MASGTFENHSPATWQMATVDRRSPACITATVSDAAPADASTHPYDKSILSDLAYLATGLPVRLFDGAMLRGHHVDCVRQVASGSFGEVYELSVRTDGLRYAWKRIDTTAARDLLRRQGSTLEPENEIQLLRELAHENVVRLVSSWIGLKELSLIFEVCSTDLLQQLLAYGPMDRPTGRVYMQQLLEALRYIHTEKIAHRDVKPENLLLSASSMEFDVLKLCDFGLAHKCSRFEGCTTFIGSADYVAPEVRLYAEGRTYGFACDSWSCGVVAYALLTAEPPYADDTNTWVRSHGLVVPHELIFRGAEPTPYSFIRACMVMSPEGRELPSSLMGLLWK